MTYYVILNKKQILETENRTEAIDFSRSVPDSIVILYCHGHEQIIERN